MNPSNFPQYRGMQVHAVPDSDKAFDSTGRKLPWAYDLNPNAGTPTGQRDPVEKGPFGRGTNRRTRSTLSRSRSKTAEPKREEDRLRAEQLAAEDAVFGGMRRVVRDTVAGVDDGEAGKEAVRGLGAGKEEEATEVTIYGFGMEVQWAALDFYERVSEGVILEDYERGPPTYRTGSLGGFKYGNLRDSIDRHPIKYTRETLRKKNTYAGGNHWIKVTLNSKNAAELACARSPHVVRGYLVYAEPYEQRGPGRDEAIPATQAGAQLADERVPLSFSTTNGSIPLENSPGGSSTTATSATATAARANGNGNGGSQTSSTNTLDNIFAPQRFAQQQTQRQQYNGIPLTPISSRPADANTGHTQTPGPETLRRRRISGAKLAQLHPATMALAPKKTKQSWSAWVLGTGDVIGSTVPKREDGAFDWEKAGVYWRVFFWLDGVLGTDFCGLKAD